MSLRLPCWNRTSPLESAACSPGAPHKPSRLPNLQDGSQTRTHQSTPDILAGGSQDSRQAEAGRCMRCFWKHRDWSGSCTAPKRQRASGIPHHWLPPTSRRFSPLHPPSTSASIPIPFPSIWLRPTLTSVRAVQPRYACDSPSLFLKVVVDKSKQSALCTPPKRQRALPVLLRPSCWNSSSTPQEHCRCSALSPIFLPIRTELVERQV
mmetsp:Transcript_42954/g.86189  ORF Transcript_42954/g.86189 Transcript_42954/m.86189 type:complete len:208 (-) Transcript_42954:266-889(-)